MPNLLSKIFKGKGKTDPWDAQFLEDELQDNPRYDAIKTLQKRQVVSQIWFDDVALRYGIKTERTIPDILCLLVTDSTLSSVFLMSAGWTVLSGEIPEKVQTSYLDLTSSPSFLVRKSAAEQEEYKKIAEKVNEDENDLESKEKLESLMNKDWGDLQGYSVGSEEPGTPETKSDHPIVCLIAAEKFGYKLPANPYTNVPILPEYVTALMRRYLKQPDVGFFDAARATMVDHLQRLYSAEDSQKLKESAFEKRISKEFQQFHKDLVRGCNWDDLKKEGAAKKYHDIYKKYH